MRETNDPLRFETTEGPAGLRVVRQAPPAGSASFSATYVAPAGWGFDPDGDEGTARIVNQLVTSGAGSRDRLELARFLDRTGATLTAQVDPESAEISIWGPSDVWPTLLGVLADTVLRPRYADSDLARVRRQLAERQLRELAQPASRVERELLHAIFAEGHPYRGTGIGDARSVGRIGRGRIDRFHERHFTADGAVLVVTGPPSLATVRRTTRRLFATLSTTRAPSLSVPAPRPPRRREIRVDLPGRAQVEVRVGGASLARGDAHFPGAFLANEVLGGAMLLSRLFRRVRSRGGLAYHASSHVEAMRFGGYWGAQAGTGADRWRKVVPMLLEEVERLSGENIPKGELNLVRESRIGEIALSLESTSDAHELAVDAAYHGFPEDHWIRWPTVLRALTPREVRAAAEVALDARNSVTALAGPIGST
ncbi:MAG: pitrilysin family protein [Thermoplasmata archaeon]